MSFEITLVANPENRRATMFVDAVESRGGRCRMLPWIDVLNGARPERGARVRIDSFGENWEVESWFLDEQVPEDRGRIRGLETTYGRFAELISTFPTADYMTPPAAILGMYDKLATKERLEAAGLRPPRTYGLVRTFSGLRDALRDVGKRRAFVKPRHGSSASGVIALTMDDQRVSARTSIERDGDTLYNSLQIRRYTTHAGLGTVVDLLGREDELIVEEWVPKATTTGGTYDFRIVPIGGEAQHAVARVSKSPMTNLHLGNARGNLAEIRVQLGASWGDIVEVARRSVAAFPGALYAGVDVAITADRSRITPFEVNAFGDLVPGIVDDLGRDTYQAEVDAFTGRRTSP